LIIENFIIPYSLNHPNGGVPNKPKTTTDLFISLPTTPTIKKKLNILAGIKKSPHYNKNNFTIIERILGKKH